MATYWSILEKMRGSSLRLTKMDDDIYEHFRKEFPEFDPRETIDEDKMKSKEGKERWRNFMMAYEKKVEDYNYGTMLRASPRFEYGQKETIFGLQSLTYLDGIHANFRTPAMRMQFYAIEIARYVHGYMNKCVSLMKFRNREGLNDWIYEKEHPDNKKKT